MRIINIIISFFRRLFCGSGLVPETEIGITEVDTSLVPEIGITEVDCGSGLIPDDDDI